MLPKSFIEIKVLACSCNGGPEAIIEDEDHDETAVSAAGRAQFETGNEADQSTISFAPVP